MVKVILYLFFGIRGRINRKQWWFGVSICSFPSYLLWQMYIMNLKIWRSGNLLWIPIALLLVCCLWMFFAVSLKRHHDRNRPEWWTIVLAIVAIPFWILGLAPSLQGLRGLIAFFWIIFFGCFPGDAGENRYGPPPKPLFKKESA
ncbi:MAG: DUF805 domain-containing protein [Candidatus Poribacteria bacterium]|nr:DUF805 domain-containing protein [Candidatus Poribacteria bacterium]MDE0397667.1 DUF805 domain-containing protein [Candidatus Poribacteria bacterium]